MSLEEEFRSIAKLMALKFPDAAEVGSCWFASDVMVFGAVIYRVTCN